MTVDQRSPHKRDFRNETETGAEAGQIFGGPNKRNATTGCSRCIFFFLFSARPSPSRARSRNSVGYVTRDRVQKRETS